MGTAVSQGYICCPLGWGEGQTATFTEAVERNGPDLASGAMAREVFKGGKSARNGRSGECSFSRQKSSRYQALRAGRLGVQMAKVGGREFRGVCRALWVPGREGFYLKEGLVVKPRIPPDSCSPIPSVSLVTGLLHG